MATKTIPKTQAIPKSKLRPSVKQADSKGRITLGNRFSNRTVLVEETPQGDILIRLAAVVPDRESWLYKNPKALAMVLEGIEQARQRKFVKGPDLKADLKYVNFLPDDEE